MRKKVQPPAERCVFRKTWVLKFPVSAMPGVCCLMLVPGCAVGPDYERPSIKSPAAFRGDRAPANNSFADLDWWHIYQDTILQTLVREAFTNNYALRIALARVEQARALAMQARSQFVPNVSFDSTVSRGRNEASGSPVPNH